MTTYGNQIIASSLPALHRLSAHIAKKDFYPHLLQTVINIIPTADAGFLFIYDDKMNKILIHAAVGYDPESYRKTQLAPGEGISGAVYQTGEVHRFNGRDNIRQAMSTMTAANRQYYEQSLMAEDYPRAVLSFPLLSEGKVCAVLTINGFSSKARFGSATEDLVHAAAPYLSVLFNYHTVSCTERNLREELSVTYTALQKEHRQLQRTTDLYNDLALLINRNRSIDEMLQVIHATVKIPVALYDQLLFPIASRGTEEEHTLPDHFLSTQEVQYILSVKKWRLMNDGAKSILIMPIVGAETVIGFLCAWIKEENFDDGSRLLLEYAASMVGLEMMKKRSVEETYRQVAGDVFEQLISGELNEDVVRQARNLNLDENDYYAILICVGQQKSSGMQQYFIKESWRKSIEHAMKVAGIGGLVTQRGLDIIAFLTVDGKESKKHARNLMKGLTEQLELIPHDVKIGIGRVYRGFNHAKESFTDAVQCLNIVRKKNNGKVWRYADGGIYRLLLDHSREELELYVYDHLGPLVEIKTKKSQELLHTLLMYVSYNRNMMEVTQVLSVHQNTLYYRIRRIEELLEVSFGDHDDWLNITIACKIYLFLNDSVN